MAVSNQGGVKNYLGNQKMVKAPLHWQSAPNHPKTELAYITDAEKKLLIKKDLHKSLHGGVNRGPAGIMSLNGWGSSDSSQNRAGADISASMDRSGSDAGWSAPGGHTSPHAKSPAELKAIADQAGSSTVMPESFYGRTYKDKTRGGGLGALLRAGLSIFGGIPGKLMSGIMTAKNWAGNQGRNLWSGAQNFGEGVKEFSEHDNLMSYLNRNKVQAVESIPTNQEIIGKRVGQDQGYYGPGSIYDQSVMPNNLTNNMGVNNQFNDPYFLAPGAKDGGRIGYKWGDSVNPEESEENILEFMQDQGVPSGEMVEAGPTEEQISMVIDMDGRGMGIDEIMSFTQLGKEDILNILGIEMAQGGIARLL
jgi:hypothetical protein